MNTKNKKIHSITNVIKFISGIISWTALVLLVIIAGFLLYYFVSVKLYAQKGEQYKPAFSLYTILSPSMEPNIKVYDVIFDISVKNPEDVKVGDVITFTSTATLTRGMTITHRVVQVIQEGNSYSYMTKGDNNLSNDGAAVPFQNIQGKVLFKIPQLGRLQAFLGTKGGWLIVVVIPALLVIISDILKIFRLKDAKKQVEDLEEKEKRKKQEEEARKEKIKESLMEKYEVPEKVEEEIVSKPSENIFEDTVTDEIEKELDLHFLDVTDLTEKPKEEIELPKLKDKEIVLPKKETFEEKKPEEKKETGNKSKENKTVELKKEVTKPKTANSKPKNNSSSRTYNSSYNKPKNRQSTNKGKNHNSKNRKKHKKR